MAERIDGTKVKMHYIVEDHLGSVTTITDDTGAIVERDSYDAWGKRRHPNGNDDAGCAISGASTRGFTGHEMLDQFCLVNMNGRIYDPVIARFLSADDRIPNPFAIQSYNRYAYVNDNPLNATDPTGHVSAETVVVHAPFIRCIDGCMVDIVTANAGFADMGSRGGGSGPVETVVVTAQRPPKPPQTPLTPVSVQWGQPKHDPCPRSDHLIQSWDLTFGDIGALRVGANYHGSTLLYGVGGGASGQIDFGLGGNLWSAGVSAYNGPAVVSNVTFGLLLGVSITSTMTANGNSFSVDWNVGTFGLSAFAGTGVASQMCEE